eukprot:jgi/Mesvir1/20245/Mv13479-RA.1
MLVGGRAALPFLGRNQLNCGASGITIFDTLDYWVATHPPNFRLFTWLSPSGAEEASLNPHSLQSAIDRVAWSLVHEWKVPIGGRAVLWYPSGLPFIVAMLACMRARVVAVPVYPPHPGSLGRDLPKLATVVASSGACVALTTTGYNRARKVSAVVPTAQIPWHTTDDLHHKPVKPIRGPPGTFRASHDAGPLWKGMDGSVHVMASGPLDGDIHPSDERAGAGTCMGLADTGGKTAVNWLPQYHDFGLVVYLGGLVFGTHVIGFSPTTFLSNPSLWLPTISTHRGFFTACPNFALEYCLRKVPPSVRQRLDLSPLKLVMMGGEPNRATTLERFSQEFAVCGFSRDALYPAYDLAENVCLVSGRLITRTPLWRAIVVSKRALQAEGRCQLATPETPTEGDKHGGRRNSKRDDERSDERTSTKDNDERDNKDNKVPAADGNHQAPSGGHHAEDSDRLTLVAHGYTPPGVGAIRIVDPDTREALPEMRLGEIWVQAPWMGDGYWGLDELSRETFAATIMPCAGISAPGAGRGGDLFICGRCKDLIIIHGRNLFPQDVELSLEATPALRPGCSAVFAMPRGALRASQRAYNGAAQAKRNQKLGGGDARKAALDHGDGRKAGHGSAARAAVQRDHAQLLSGLALLPHRSIPKTSLGKVQRRRCRQLLQAGQLAILHLYTFGEGDHGLTGAPHHRFGTHHSARDHPSLGSKAAGSGHGDSAHPGSAIVSPYTLEASSEDMERIRALRPGSREQIRAVADLLWSHVLARVLGPDASSGADGGRNGISGGEGESDGGSSGSGGGEGHSGCDGGTSGAEGGRNARSDGGGGDDGRGAGGGDDGDDGGDDDGDGGSRSRAPGRPPLDESLWALGMTSLRLVESKAAAEHVFRVSLPMEALFDCGTVGDVARLVATAMIGGDTGAVLDSLNHKDFTLLAEGPVTSPPTRKRHHKSLSPIPSSPLASPEHKHKPATEPATRPPSTHLRPPEVGEDGSGCFIWPTPLRELLQVLGILLITALFFAAAIPAYAAGDAVLRRMHLERIHRNSATGYLWASLAFSTVGIPTGVLVYFAAIMLLTVAFKWVVIGRYREGSYPMWSTYFLRWWTVERMVAISSLFLENVEDTPLASWYLWAMGATVGRNVTVDSVFLCCFDLITLGDNSVVRGMIYPYVLTPGSRSGGQTSQRGGGGEEGRSPGGSGGKGLGGGTAGHEGTNGGREGQGTRTGGGQRPPRQTAGTLVLKRISIGADASVAARALCMPGSYLPEGQTLPSLKVCRREAPPVDAAPLAGLSPGEISPSPPGLPTDMRSPTEPSLPAPPLEASPAGRNGLLPPDSEWEEKESALGAVEDNSHGVNPHESIKAGIVADIKADGDESQGLDPQDGKPEGGQGTAAIGSTVASPPVGGPEAPALSSQAGSLQAPGQPAVAPAPAGAIRVDSKKGGSIKLTSKKTVSFKSYNPAADDEGLACLDGTKSPYTDGSMTPVVGGVGDADAAAPTGGRTLH